MQLYLHTAKPIGGNHLKSLDIQALYTFTSKDDISASDRRNVARSVRRYLNENGKKGMGRRQCTREYKITPIAKKIREIMGLVPRQRF
jgi:hypothetical protein